MSGSGVLCEARGQQARWDSYDLKGSFESSKGDLPTCYLNLLEADPNCEQQGDKENTLRREIVVNQRVIP